MKGSKSVDNYILENPRWQEALELMRGIFLQTELSESIKWGVPVFSVDGKNVAGIAAFKNYAGIWFYQGAFINDPDGKLFNANEGVTRGLRQWRFTSAEEVASNAGLILQYTREAIENARKGLEIKIDRNKPVVLPEELATELDADKNLKNAFEEFTPAKQREFAEYIATAKRAETRAARIDKIVPMILLREGLNDKYTKK